MDGLWVFLAKHLSHKGDGCGGGHRAKEERACLPLGAVSPPHPPGGVFPDSTAHQAESSSAPLYHSPEPNTVVGMSGRTHASNGKCRALSSGREEDSAAP